MNFIFMGPPGSGKGTQSEFIVNKFGLKSISTGDMFRAAITEKTLVGLKAKKYIDNGELVPDEVTIDIVKERLLKKDFSNGFIIDGFPRTIPQAKAFELLLQELNLKLDKVVFIDVPEDELVKRLTSRKTCIKCNAIYNEAIIGKEISNCTSCGGQLYRRDDDKEEVIRKRIKTYNRETLPLIDYYKERNFLVLIDGTKSPEFISCEILEKLGF